MTSRRGGLLWLDQSLLRIIFDLREKLCQKYYDVLEIEYDMKNVHAQN